MIRRLVMPTMLSKGSSEYAAAALGFSVAALFMQQIESQLSCAGSNVETASREESARESRGGESVRLLNSVPLKRTNQRPVSLLCFDWCLILEWQTTLRPPACDASKPD